MKVKFFIFAFATLCHSFAFAESERNTISPFISAGFATGNNTIEVYVPDANFLDKARGSETSSNIFADIGFKINIKSFFIAPRIGISSKNSDMEFFTRNGNTDSFSSSAVGDVALIFGMHEKQSAFYFFFGRSLVKYENASARQEIKINYFTVGFGYEYYIAKKVSLFGELVGYYADRFLMEIKVDGVEVNDSQQRLIDAESDGIRIKLGVRFYPIG